MPVYAYSSGIGDIICLDPQYSREPMDQPPGATFIVYGEVGNTRSTISVNATNNYGYLRDACYDA